jgi:putative transposase
LIFKEYQMLDRFIVKNDNGRQFEADIVQKYLKEKGVNQEFTKLATPQQNAHIE